MFRRTRQRDSKHPWMWDRTDSRKAAIDDGGHYIGSEIVGVGVGKQTGLQLLLSWQLWRMVSTEQIQKTCRVVNVTWWGTTIGPWGCTRKWYRDHEAWSSNQRDFSGHSTTRCGLRDWFLDRVVGLVVWARKVFPRVTRMHSWSHWHRRLTECIRFNRAPLPERWFGRGVSELQGGGKRSGVIVDKQS